MSKNKQVQGSGLEEYAVIGNFRITAAGGKRYDSKPVGKGE